MNDRSRSKSLKFQRNSEFGIKTLGKCGVNRWTHRHICQKCVANRRIPEATVPIPGSREITAKFRLGTKSARMPDLYGAGRSGTGRDVAAHATCDAIACCRTTEGSIPSCAIGCSLSSSCRNCGNKTVATSSIVSRHTMRAVGERGRWSKSPAWGG